MKRRLFVVLVLMAAIVAYGSERRAQPLGFDGHYFNGPVCLPGDPCGPDATRVLRVHSEFAGPMCFPGDPCGWPGIIQAPLNGPVCYPGDPCGPQPISLELQVAGSKFNGPVCYPGDPCGPGGRQ